MKVDKKIATIYVNGGEKDKAIRFSIESKPNLSFHNTGGSSSYDWSSFFKINRRNNGNGIVRLKKSLEGAFQVRWYIVILSYLKLTILISTSIWWYNYVQHNFFLAWSKVWGVDISRTRGKRFHLSTQCSCSVWTSVEKLYRIWNRSWVSVQYHFKTWNNTYRYNTIFKRIVFSCLQFWVHSLML